MENHRLSTPNNGVKAQVLLVSWYRRKAGLDKIGWKGSGNNLESVPVKPTWCQQNNPIVSREHCVASAKQHRSAHKTLKCPKGDYNWTKCYQSSTVPAYLKSILLRYEEMSTNLRCRVSAAAKMSFKREYVQSSLAVGDMHRPRPTGINHRCSGCQMKGSWPAGRSDTSQRKMSPNAAQPVVILSITNTTGLEVSKLWLLFLPCTRSWWVTCRLGDTLDEKVSQVKRLWIQFKDSSSRYQNILRKRVAFQLHRPHCTK